MDITVITTLQRAINVSAKLRDKVDTSLILVYSIGSELIYETAIISGEEGDYTTQTLINIATIQYQKNTIVVTLPFSLIVGDILKTTITKTDATIESRVSILGTRIQ